MSDCVCMYVRRVNGIDGITVDVLQEKKWRLSLQSWRELFH